MESIIAYFTFLLDSINSSSTHDPHIHNHHSLSSNSPQPSPFSHPDSQGYLDRSSRFSIESFPLKKRPRDGPIQTYIEDLHNALTKSFESSIKENRGTVIASRPSSKSILQYDGSVHLYTKANLHLIAYTASLEPIAYPIPRQTLTPTGLNQYRFTKTIHEPLLSSRKVDVAVALDGCDVSDAFFGTDMLRIDGKMLAVLRRLNDEEDKLNI
ncbi:hypothetical protein BC829DRAFT_446565 [Chytridium lagenaria]|nr:hypothetical protein BC829DRAFT_446565 [Chytridium lagenaria]